MKNTIKYIFFGILMGGANVIPGVSGGTMAIVLNFYDRLMESITLNIKTIIKNLNFLIPLAIGLVIGILGLSKIINYLLGNFPTQTYIAFVGIIFGSIPLIYSKARLKKKTISGSSWLVFAILLAIMIFMAFANADKANAIIKYTTFSFEAAMACFFAMVVGAATMIIPGISGSLMLLIMGMYGTIYGYVIANFYIPLLIPTGLGAAVGILGGAKLMNVLLSKHEQLAYMAILGLLVGSIVELLKRSNVFGGGLFVLVTSIIAGVIMFVIVYNFSLAEIKRDLKGE